MYVNMCLKFCLYWTVKSNVFYSQKFENHGFKPFKKANNCLYILSLAQSKKKKCVYQTIFKHLSLWLH